MGRRTNWRQDLSQPRPVQLTDLSSQNLANARLAQFPLEQQAREASISRAAAAEAHARYQLGKEIETDRQRTAFYNGLQELEKNLNAQGLPIGTKGHAEAYAAYAHEFPLARSSSDVDQTLKLHAVVNDDQAALAQRMQQKIDAGEAVGLQPEGASFIKGGDVDVRFSKPGTAIPGNVAQRHARVQGQIQGFTDESAQQQAANIAAGKANVPYTNANLLHAAQVESALLEQRFPGLVQPQAAASPDQRDQPAPDQSVSAPMPTDTPSAMPVATASPAATAAPSATPINHSDALDWANANPNDPRAAVILQRAQSAMPQDEGQ
jgi:hypothetical protein